MKFSERIGISKVDVAIQTNGMSEALRNSLWNVLDIYIFSGEGFLYNRYGGPGAVKDFSRRIWFGYFKRPMDTISRTPEIALASIREYFFECKWFQVYELLEFIAEVEKNSGILNGINHVLETELSGFRLFEGRFIPVTDDSEVNELREAISELPFTGVTAHLKQAMNHLARHESPDYRNSIKESISAVECMAREVSGNQKATLGDALVILEKSGTLHPALKKGFSAIYGYSNDESGIRHAMLDEPNITVSDAETVKRTV